MQTLALFSIQQLKLNITLCRLELQIHQVVLINEENMKTTKISKFQCSIEAFLSALWQIGYGFIEAFATNYV